MSDGPPVDAPTTNAERPLSGWKEIAAYLGVATRTAMRYPDKSGLPIHRKKLKTGERIYAFRGELDAWIKDRGLEQAPGKRRPLLIPTLVAAIMAAAVTGLVLFRDRAGIWLESPASPADAQPSHWSISSNELRVLAANGRHLWTHRFPAPLQASVYGTPDEPWDRPGMIQIVDLEGDGANEVLIVANIVGRPIENRLYCFNADGSLRFRHEPPNSVTFGNTVYGEPFTSRYLLVSGTGGKRSMWVVSSHISNFPTVVQKLDRSGVPEGEFWANGHVQTLADVTLAEQRYLAVGGTSNDRGGGFLAMLDHEHPAGRMPSINPEFACRNCPAADPRAAFYFPALDVARALVNRPFVVELRTLPAGGLRVTLNHGRIATPLSGGARFATAYYTFGPDLRLTTTAFGDDYPNAHVTLEVAGQLRHRFGATDHAELALVDRWDGRVLRRLQIAPD